MDGNQYDACAECGAAALPFYGVYLCPMHASRKTAERVKREREEP